MFLTPSRVATLEAACEVNPRLYPSLVDYLDTYFDVDIQEGETYAE